MNEWKLYFDQIKEIKDSNLGPILINMDMDPIENVNRLKEFPSKVKSMQILAKKLLLEIEKNSIPLGGPANPKKGSVKKAVWLK